MPEMTRFPALNIETATPEARPLIAGSLKQFGYLPEAVAKAAHSPALLRLMFAGFAAFEQTTLSHDEREVVAMSVAREIGCHYCMALHSALNADPERQALIAALRAGTTPPEPRLAALSTYVRALVRERGRISERDWSALTGAGFSRAQALEVVLGVGVYLLSTLTNIVTNAELDAPLEPFRWHPPAG
jgi:AhpD family alkylhydroperoxidase